MSTENGGFLCWLCLLDQLLEASITSQLIVLLPDGKCLTLAPCFASTKDQFEDNTNATETLVSQWYRTLFVLKLFTGGDCSGISVKFISCCIRAIDREFVPPPPVKVFWEPHRKDGPVKSLHNKSEKKMNLSFPKWRVWRESVDLYSLNNEGW